MSQETKAKRLASLDARIKRGEEKIRDLRTTAGWLEDELQGLKAEQEWLNEAPTRPDGPVANRPDTQEGQQ